MRVPLSWLGEFVELPANSTPADVMGQLVRVGLEEEGEHGGGLSGPIVVGEVLEFSEEPQANGKTIRWCQVRVAPQGEPAKDGGADVRGIVCGAANFFVGDKVVVSLPGAVLPGDFQISARKTYGHISDGMIASAKELGLGDDHAGILRLSTMELDPKPGTDALELLGLSDSAAEVNVTPDRGYCLSIRGIAREYSHATGVSFTDPASLVTPVDVSGFDLSVEDSTPIHGKLGCGAFYLVEVAGLDATAPTPGWLSSRLRLAGMRSISLIVDITNYVMLEFGQPTHAYDADKLRGGILVRRAKAGEQLETLDGKVRDLDPEDLLITDDSGPIGIAGVMGGASTEVSLQTTRVMLEAAHFDPISVARSARRHKLPSEASKRFERGVDPMVAKYAAARLVQLLTQLAGGKLTGVGADYGKIASPGPIELNLNFPGALVGVSYSAAQIQSILESIGCRVSVAGDIAIVTPPSWRPDLTHKTDLVEEVARLAGYDLIPSRLPVAPPGSGLTRRQQLRRRALSALAAAGHVEVLNYPFLSQEQNRWFGLGQAVVLENPIQGEAPEMRRSLLPGLLAAAARNHSRGLTDLAIFEEGSVFLEAVGKPVKQLPAGNSRPPQSVLEALKQSIPEQPRMLAVVFTGFWMPSGPGREAVTAGYPQAMDAARLVANQAGLEIVLHQVALPGFHPGRSANLVVGETVIGQVGEIDPAIAESLHLPRRVAALELNLDLLHSLSPQVLVATQLRVMPAATQDLSLVVDLELPAATLLESLKNGAGELLESIVLVDDYRGQSLPLGKKSLTFALRFRAADRTLTQVEASSARDQAVAAASSLGAEIRG